MKILYRISFLLLFVFLLPYLNIRSQQSNSAAYNISLQNQNGTFISLDKNVGKYVYLHFWASWCEESLLQLPILNDIYAHYYQASFANADGFEIFSVSLDADKTEWLNKLSENELIWPQQVCDFKSYASPVCRQYQITSTPASFLISPNGTIIAKNISPKELEVFLDEDQSKARFGSSRQQLIQTFSQNANQPTYKIQLGVFKFPNLQKFAHIQHLGKLETELTPEGFTRIMLSSFNSEAETNAVLAQIKNQANCQQAFVLAVPTDILPTPASTEKGEDFWANVQSYNAGITPPTSTTTKATSTFYDQNFNNLMSQPIVEKIPETIVPAFGISDEVFSKQDNRQVKVTIYAPKEQPPAIRLIETVADESLPQNTVASNTIYNPNEAVSKQTYSQKPLAVVEKTSTKTKASLLPFLNMPTTTTNEINVAYGISESYTKPNESGEVITKIFGKPAATTNQPKMIVETQPPTVQPSIAEKQKEDIPTYDYNAALQRSKQKEKAGKTVETDKNWVAPEYYPSEHNKDWRDYSVVNKADDTKSDANWDPKKQSAVPAPPKVEKQLIVETEESKDKKETYNYENKKKNSKAVKAIPNKENFKWEPKKSHTYPTSYPRKETELPLPDNVDIPKYDYPKKLVEEQEKKKEEEKDKDKETLDKTDKMTRKEKRKKKRLERKANR